MQRKIYFLLTSLVILLTNCAHKDGAKQAALTDQNWLKISGDQIVNLKGDTVCLRGFGLGGMLHMENFIDGYPANEETMREGLRSVLGEKKYNLYFDTFLKSYF